ncbi:MAG: glycosyltransferase family 2 protein [Dolichospermum sp. DET73]|jgi:glycosyltransferase involved in cell wall biosynthesis|nr:glycosyltransferase family 2 protein [Dolichospermum sp. DET73]
MKEVKYRPKGLTLAICTYNGKLKLEKTLEHILVQQVDSSIAWELLVIDNASTDNTSDFIYQIWPDDRLHEIRIIREEKLGAIHARQRAIREAKYSYLSYVDDDNWISYNWVTEVYKIFESYPTVGIISCPSTASLSETPPEYFEMVKGWLAIGSQCKESGLIHKRPISFWTAGCSFRLVAFDVLQNSGFKPCLTGRKGLRPLGGEDHELCLILTMCGWDVYFSHEISFKHQIPNSRLQIDYLKYFILSSVRCKVILDIYREYYNQQMITPVPLKLFYYLFEFLSRFIALIVKQKILFRQDIFPNYISLMMSKGALLGYFDHFSDTQQAIKNIKIAEAIKQKNSLIQI